MKLSKGQWSVVLVAALVTGAGTAATHGAAQASKAPAKQAGAGDTAAADAKAAETYKSKCSICHAMDGNSPLPNMSFADGVWKHGTTVKEMVNTISNGVPGTAMMPFKTQFTPEEIEALARHVRKFDKKLK
jgi:mono/diheme cytochrome c family protein